MAKTCAKCGQIMDDRAQICTNCNSSEFIGTTADNQSQVYTQAPPAYTLNGQQGGLPEFPEKEKVMSGILGAILFSLAGGILYVILYQFGILSAICGYLTFILAELGYKKLSKTKDTYSVKALIISIILLFVVIFAAEYICLSIDIFKVYSEYYEITFLDAFLSAPAFLTDSEVLKAVLSDLGFSYLFGLLAIISNVIRFFKGRKAEKEAITISQQPPVEQSVEESTEQ